MRDRVWSFLDLPAFAWAVADTPVFQRLRFLRQTGLLHFVFPSSTHTRFEHSLGTAHCAHVLLKNLVSAQPELGITPAQVATTVLAALCHDLGHGPASHAFDHFMAAVDVTWTHEAQGAVLLEYLVAQHPDVAAALAAAGADVAVACDVIRGGRALHPYWLADIVSNKRSGLDVDKLDYLCRDSLHLGLPVAFDAGLLLRSCRVVDNELAWPVAAMPDVQGMFTARFDMHRRAYQHPESVAITVMAMTALRELGASVCVGDGVPLTAAVAHPAAFVRTTDWVIDLALQAGHAASPFLGRIMARQLWPCVAEVPLKPGGAPPDVEDLAAAAGVPVTAVVAHVTRINCGSGRFNPVSRVPMFDDVATLKPVVVADDAAIRPVSFETRTLRVFVTAPEHEAAVRAAVDVWRATTCAKSRRVVAMQDAPPPKHTPDHGAAAPCGHVPHGVVDGVAPGATGRGPTEPRHAVRVRQAGDDAARCDAGPPAPGGVHGV
jgi:hypothetical protein